MPDEKKPDSTTPFGDIVIPEVDITTASAFKEGILTIDDAILKPSIRYKDWWDVTNLNGTGNGSGGKPPDPFHPLTDPDRVEVDTIWQMEEVILLRSALCTHSDTFRSDDDSKLALSIATTGLSSEIGKFIMKQDLMGRIFEDLIPLGAVRNNLSSRLILITYNQVMNKVKELLATSPLNSALPIQRHYLLFIMTEILVRVGGAFIGIERRRDITITRAVHKLFPTRADLNLFMQASYIKMALTSLATSIATNKPRTPLAMRPAIQGITDTLISFGRELRSVAQTSDALAITLGVVKWFLSTPLVSDFPPEMKLNANLIALSGNATIVREAMIAAPTSVINRLSMWAWAMEQVVKAIKDPAYFRTMRLSEFESYCGLSHIYGARKEIKGSLFWMNLPGSAPVFAYDESEIDSQTRIGEANSRPDVDITMKSLTAAITRMDGQAWATELQAYLRHMLGGAPTGTPNAVLKPGEKEIPRANPIFVRFAAPEEAVWFYAVSRLRRVYPRFTGNMNASSVTYDFIVQVEDINVNLSVPVFQGRIRTPDARIALMGLEGHTAQSQLPLLTDGIPEQDKDSLLYLDQLPIFDDFNKTGVVIEISPTRIAPFKVVTKNWFSYVGLPKYQDIKLTELTRTKLLLNIWDTVINEINSRVVETAQSKFYLARLRAFVLKDLMTDTNTALSIHHGFLLSIINRIGEPIARAEIESDLNQNVMLTRLLIILGAEIMINSGLAIRSIPTAWIQLLEDTNWFAVEGSTNTWSKQYGLKH